MMGLPRSVILICGMLFATSGHTAATLEAVTGDVRTGLTAPAAAPARTGQRIDRGSLVLTGPKSRATLRFDDGQAVALHESSEFRIAEYAFSKDQPAADRSRFELLRGALRAVSGLIAQRNPQAGEYHLLRRRSPTPPSTVHPIPPKRA